MNRIYCLACKVFYTKVKTGFTVSLGKNSGLEVRGDQYVCPCCDNSVFGDFGEPFQAKAK